MAIQSFEPISTFSMTFQLHCCALKLLQSGQAAKACEIWNKMLTQEYYAFEAAETCREAMTLLQVPVLDTNPMDVIILADSQAVEQAIIYGPSSSLVYGILQVPDKASINFHLAMGYSYLAADIGQDLSLHQAYLKKAVLFGQTCLWCLQEENLESALYPRENQMKALCLNSLERLCQQ